MRRWMVVPALAAVALPGGAHAISVGAGVFAGPSFPVVQEDTGNGVQFGIRVPVHLVPLLTIEPFYARTNLGNVTETFGGLEYERSGFDVNAFGATVALGGVGLAAGMPFYPYGSIASYKMTRDGSPDLSEVGYEAGLGFGLRLPPSLAVSLRAGLCLVATGDTSRKFANVNVGVSTRIFGLP